jgi:molecular chaperone GrpE
MSDDSNATFEPGTPADTSNAAMHAAETERLAVLERENADLKDRLLRALAETENVRRRAEREAQDGRLYGITSFAKDMLNTADNLHRALDALSKSSEGTPEPQEAEAAFKTFLDGVELTERELIKTLERHGVKKREPMGEKFDPHRDQAMFEVLDETLNAGTVIQVVQTGYVIGERVLRPALVGVSKGGPRAANEAAAELGKSEFATPEKPADAPQKPRFDKRA